MNELRAEKQEKNQKKVKEENTTTTTTRARARLYGIDVDVARRLLAKLRERPIPPEECIHFKRKGE
jgi:hypothetical protein